MTDKQKLFAAEYLVDLNATQAAIRAGYSKKTAYSIGTENLKKPEIKKYIDEKLEQMSSKRLAKAQEVLEYLTSVMRGEVMEETVRFVGDGVQEIDEIDTSTRERTKAAELLGRYYSLWTERVRVDGTHQVVILDNIPGGAEYD